jgi:hypothetical protein
MASPYPFDFNGYDSHGFSGCAVNQIPSNLSYFASGPILGLADVVNVVRLSGAVGVGCGDTPLLWARVHFCY